MSTKLYNASYTESESAELMSLRFDSVRAELFGDSAEHMRQTVKLALVSLSGATLALVSVIVALIA